MTLPASSEHTLESEIKPKRVVARWWLAPVTITGLFMELPLVEARRHGRPRIGAICGFGALTAGLCFGMRFNLGLPAVLAVGLLGGLAAMLALPPAITASWPTFCFQIELALRHRTPVRLMRFLEDARERGVLRTVGPIYQFRHAELQDRLAANVSKPE